MDDHIRAHVMVDIWGQIRSDVAVREDHFAYRTTPYIFGGPCNFADYDQYMMSTRHFEFGDHPTSDAVPRQTEQHVKNELKKKTRIAILID